VIIEDVSLIANYRAQFSRILRDYPYTGLVARMKGEAPEASTSDATADSQSVSWPRWIIGHMGDERGAAEPSLPERTERDCRLGLSCRRLLRPGCLHAHSLPSAGPAREPGAPSRCGHLVGRTRGPWRA